MNLNDVKTSVSAYLIVKNADQAIKFYSQILGGEEVFRLTDAKGRIGHAEMRFGHTRVMLADEYPEYGSLAPDAVERASISLHLQVPNVDEVFAHALTRGATEIRAIQDEFHGNRGGVLKDPFGHTWHIQTPIEFVSADEMQKRWDTMMIEMP